MSRGIAALQVLLYIPPRRVGVLSYPPSPSPRPGTFEQGGRDGEGRMRDDKEICTDNLRSALWNLQSAKQACERAGFGQALDQIEEAIKAAGAALREIGQ